MDISKKLLILTVSILLNCGGVAWASDAKKLFEDGNIKMNLNDFKGAIKDYSQAIDLNTKYKEAYLKRAQAKAELKDYFGAIIDYNVVIEMDPNSIIAYMGRGEAKGFLLDYRGAIKDYDRAIKIDNENKDAIFRRGKAEMALESYAESISDFTRLIKLDPKNADAYYLRGIIKTHQGKIESGCLDLSKAGELGDEKAYDKIAEVCVP